MINCRCDLGAEMLNWNDNVTNNCVVIVEKIEFSLFPYEFLLCIYVES